MSKKYIYFALGFFLAASVLWANPVVRRISVTPANFRARDVLTISCEIENRGNTPYGCMGASTFCVFLTVLNSPTSTSPLWNAAEALRTPLAPGERRTITFSRRWGIRDYSNAQLVFVVGAPYCNVDEQPAGASVTYTLNCAYSAPAWREMPNWSKSPVFKRLK